MAPIFDSGNSMFWQNPKVAESLDFFEITVNSFSRKEIDLWKYVKSPHLRVLDWKLLPAEQELSDIYAMDPMILCVDSIVEGYQRKVNFISL